MEKVWVFEIIFISTAFTSLGIISASINVNAENHLQTEIYKNQTTNNASKIVTIFEGVNSVGKFHISQKSHSGYYYTAFLIKFLSMQAISNA